MRRPSPGHIWWLLFLGTLLAAIGRSMMRAFEGHTFDAMFLIVWLPIWWLCFRSYRQAQGVYRRPDRGEWCLLAFYILFSAFVWLFLLV